jgi:hypothetical protein
MRFVRWVEVVCCWIAELSVLFFAAYSTNFCFCIHLGFMRPYYRPRYRPYLKTPEILEKAAASQ